MCWNRRLPRLIGAVHDHTAQFGKFLPQLIDCRSHIQSQVRRNLFVPAAPAMQLVSRLSNQRDQFLLYKVMHVFRILIVEKRG